MVHERKSEKELARLVEARVDHDVRVAIVPNADHSWRAVVFSQPDLCKNYQLVVDSIAARLADQFEVW